jgi:hypothetical protein
VYNFSAKKRKGWVSSRSTKGRYGFAVHNPENIYLKIEALRNVRNLDNL